MRSAHLQTLGAAMPIYVSTRSLDGLVVEKLRLPIPGGALHGEAWWHEHGERPAILVLHGVGGSSESKYAVRAAIALHRAGYHVVRLDLRGAGEGIRDAPLLSHAGLTEDPRIAVDLIARMPRVRGVAILGFSLGGNLTLKLAGEWGGNAPRAMLGVATISAPLDLVSVSRAMEQLRTFPYRRYVLRSLVRQGQAFAKIHPDRAPYDAASLPSLRTIRAYDEAVIAPMHDFAGADDYYARTSAGPSLADIRIPTLIIHADDDPMVPGPSVRPWLRDASSSVRIAISARGGHVGWFAGITEGRWVNTWAVDRALAFFREVAG